MEFAVVTKRVKDGTASISTEAPKMLAFVASIKDPVILRECRAQAAAIMEYLSHRRDLSVEEHNAALTIKLRVEHRLGEVLAVTVKKGGDRKSKSHDAILNGLPKEVSLSQSSRAQQLARVPWSEIQNLVNAKTKQNEKASQSRLVKEFVQEQQREENAELVAETTPITAVDGLFQTIVIDPPWDWGDEGDVSQFGRGRHEYAAMSFEELLDFPLAEKAESNCHLYLWITNRSLPKGFALAERWGFRYVTCLTWCKPSIGMGNYFRGSTEHVLFCVKGSLPLLRRDLGTWFSAARGDRHSSKPDEFFKMVESASPGPWLEVFARSKRNGWVAWGAEA